MARIVLRDEARDELMLSDDESLLEDSEDDARQAMRPSRSEKVKKLWLPAASAVLLMFAGVAALGSSAGLTSMLTYHKNKTLAATGDHSSASPFLSGDSGSLGSSESSFQVFGMPMLQKKAHLAMGTHDELDQAEIDKQASDLRIAAFPPETDAALEAKLRSKGPHYAMDCWKPCGGAGACSSWCGEGLSCCRYGWKDDPPSECGGVRFWPVMTFHTCVQATATPTPAPTPASGAEEPTSTTTPAPAPPLVISPVPVPLPLPPAPTFQFYVYRAQGDTSYPFGNVNAANVPGMLWYLQNEVLFYSKCPKRYGIDRIRRYLVTTKATPELFARGMNFGVRYSWDKGQCTGSNVRMIGSCNKTWDRFGYVVGCNNFRDHYPWPEISTEYPEGVWYSFPGDGKCPTGTAPTGAWNCTWSVENAGEIFLNDLEATMPGKDLCCNSNCTDFWSQRYDSQECERRKNDIMIVFAAKYPDMPSDKPAPVCDFVRSKFWE